jgi:hypothetical protein
MKIYFAATIFALVEQAIILATTNEDGTQQNSTRVKLGYHLHQACKYMTGFYLDATKENKAKDVDIFRNILDLYWPGVAGKLRKESKMAR